MNSRRGALYYPFIHLRDPDWLKATLLCFPRILRMVPPGFELNDPEQTRPFTTYVGPDNETLVDRYDLDRPFLRAVQEGFRERLEKDIAERGDRFRQNLMQRSAEMAGNPNAFQIHRAKFTGELLGYLESEGLAWAPDAPHGRSAGWVALHPTLGEAVMSTIAAAIAKEEGLNIVTSDGKIHRALVGRNVDAVYRNMVLGEWVTPEEGKGAKTDQILQLVLLTGFDLSQLTPERILEISEQREALAAIKQELDRLAAELSDGFDEKGREQELRKAAAMVIEKWGDSRRLTSKFAKSFFSAGLIDHGEGFLKDVVKDAVTVASGAAATAGTASVAAAGTAAVALAPILSSAAVIGAGAGLAVGVISYAVRAAWRAGQQKAKSPYRYLTLVSRAASEGPRAALVIQPSPVPLMQ